MSRRVPGHLPSHELVDTPEQSKERSTQTNGHLSSDNHLDRSSRPQRSSPTDSIGPKTTQIIGQSSSPLLTEARRRKNFDWLSSSATLASRLSQWQADFLTLDWPSSQMGPISSWEPWLKQLVIVVMADPEPALLYVEDDQGRTYAVIYNEALCPLIGDKHPTLQGNDPRHGFAEIWDFLEDIFSRGREEFETCIGVNQPLLLHRHGFFEDTWWTWRFMPVLRPDGCVGASYVTCADNTRDVIAQRRVAVLHTIEDRITSSADMTSLWRALASGIQDSTAEIPCALLYSGVEGGHDNVFTLAHCVGLESTDVVPRMIDLSQTGLLDCTIKQAVDSGKTCVIQVADLLMSSASFLKSKTHGEVCHQAIICPIKSRSSDKAFGFVLLALDPRAHFNDDARAFFENLSRQVSSVSTRLFLANQLSRKNEEFLESEKNFVNLTSRAPIGIALLHPSGELQYANEYWHRLVQWYHTPGCDPKGWINRVVEEDRETTMTSWGDVLAGKKVDTFQFRLVTPRRLVKSDAGEGPITVMCDIYLDHAKDGSIKSVMSCITNISDIKELEMRLRARTKEIELKVSHLLEVRKQQENFIDMTSHEIRNPLSAVLHLADDIYTSNRDLLSAIDTSHQGCNMAALRSSLIGTIESAETIVACVLHQKRIVDDILVVSRLESGVLVVTPVATQPDSLIQTALRMFEAEVRTFNTSLSFVVDESLQRLDIQSLLFDPSRVVQILVNLVGNAIKFTKLEDTRNIEVVMSASLTQPGDGDSNVNYVPVSEQAHVQSFEEEGEIVWLSLSVLDSGKGMSADEKVQLFKRFSQASKKTHTQYGGSGLGLWIAKQLTEIHGGRIGFASEENKGSNFSFFIKTVRCNPTKEFRRPSQTPSSTSRKASLAIDSFLDVSEPTSAMQGADWDTSMITEVPSPITVLVVEDNLVNQRILSRQLRKNGFIVHVANHGVEALAFLQGTSFSVPHSPLSSSPIHLSIILMDLEMPIMDGTTCIAKIREMEDQGKLNAHIPVLAVTANARGEQLDRAMQAGMDGSITKPYQLPELTAKIEQWALQFSPTTT